VAKKDYIIVDVRDDDFRGGNIVGAHNEPSETFLAGVDKLVEDTKGVKTVIFHCMLSQQRGPKAARVITRFLPIRS
jgi:rhodanese-related sulfurtransferase